MSLGIAAEEVTCVLVQGEQTWIDIVPGSLYLDAYEVKSDGHTLLEGGTVQGVPSTGFEFRPRTNPSTVIYGPLTSLLAMACEAVPS